MSTRSTWVIALHGTISVVVLSMGLYVLTENKMIMLGKLSGGLYKFNFPNNVIIAISFFLVSAFVILVLIESKRMKIINQWLIIVALVLFFIGVFI